MNIGKYIEDINSKYKKANFDESLTVRLIFKKSTILRKKIKTADTNKDKKTKKGKKASLFYIAEVPHKIYEDKIVLKADINESEISNFKNVEFFDNKHIDNIKNKKIDFHWLLFEDKYLSLLSNKDVLRKIPQRIMPSKELGTSGNVSSILLMIDKIFKGVVKIFKTQEGDIVFNIGKRSFESTKMEENFINIINLLKNDDIVNFNNIEFIILSYTMSAGIKLLLKDVI